MTFEEAIEIIEYEVFQDKWLSADDPWENMEKMKDILLSLKETYATENQEVLKLKNQIEISKVFFQNILDVNLNIRIGSPSHLANCVHVMKISAEKALKYLEEVDD